MIERAVCAICGRMAAPGIVVETAMAALNARLWTGKGDADAVRYASIPRCVDRQACRARLEAGGSKWPVVEGRMSRTVPTPPEASTPQPDARTSEGSDPWAAFGGEPAEPADEWEAFG